MEADNTDAAARARRKAERLKQWKRDNPDKVKRHSDTARASDASKARRRERDRARRERERADEERRAAARARARDWYAANRERHLEAQRQYRAAQRAADPDGYRQAKRERNKRWRDGHKEQENAKLREKYRADPEQKRAGAARYYENRAEEVKARRRQYYARNRDAQLEKQRAWRAREKRRLHLGLPAYRIQRTARGERDANRVAATMFFTRTRTPKEIETMLEELGTPAGLLAAFQRDCARARAEYRHATAPRRPEPTARSVASVAREREDERLDAIARAINDQLRRSPRNASRASEDAPVSTDSPAPTRGMGR
jgi:hypothetical protein